MASHRSALRFIAWQWHAVDAASLQDFAVPLAVDVVVFVMSMTNPKAPARQAPELKWCWPPGRWASARAMGRLREKARDRTGRDRVGRDIREVIAELNPLLRGRGNYFRTGNAAGKPGQADDDLVWRLRRLMIRKRGRDLHAGQARAWTEEWFTGHGLKGGWGNRTAQRHRRPRLPMAEVSYSANRRLLDAGCIGHDPAGGAAALEAITSPVISITCTRIPGMRFPGPRVQALPGARSALALRPAGFTGRDLRHYLAPQLGKTPEDMTGGQISYDLRRLRGHQIIERIPHSRNYQVTADGLSIALILTR